jgi:hypothetical protein
MHLSRRPRSLVFPIAYLRPGDGERWADRVSNKAQQVEFDDIVMTKNSQPVLNWAA